MSIEEFNKYQHHANMWVMYQGKRKYVISVSFTEALFGLCDDKEETPPDEWSWVRCENVEVIYE